MGKRATWADVEKGQHVELAGKVFEVAKIKAKGKKAAVVVLGSGGRFESTVKLKDEVTLAWSTKPKPAREKWHTPTKAEKAEQRAVLGKGDPAVTKPPVKAKGPAWDELAGKAEKTLAKVSGARLVADSGDVNDPDNPPGYYVPPVDATTVAAHWMIFHEGDDWETCGEAELLARHAVEHDHPRGGALKVNHWHTEQRP